MRSFARCRTASVANPRLKLSNSLPALCTASFVSFRSQHRPVCGASSLWMASRRMRTQNGSPPPAAPDSASAPEMDLMDMLLGQELGHSHNRDAAATSASAPSTSNGSDDLLDTEAGEEKEAKEENVTLRVVELHNLPRNWMHEEIVEFLHQVANHAGIDTPAASASTAARSGDGAAHNDSNHEEEEEEREGEGEDVTSAIPHVRSPFVEHMHIPFGRRTGLVYGSPRIVLRSGALARYLVNDLAFDEDDYRSRIYFSDVTPVVTDEDADEEGGERTGSAKAAASSRRAVVPQYVPVEETIEQEQAAALATLELDRYLLAPDLLLDISKMHQRRLVTRGEKVVLRAFTDMAPAANEEEEGHTASGSARGEQDEGMEAALLAAEEGVGRTRSGRAGGRGGQPRHLRRRAVSEMLQEDTKPAPRAGTMKDLGHGSEHNMPIPKPYVMGRNL